MFSLFNFLILSHLILLFIPFHLIFLSCPILVCCTSSNLLIPFSRHLSLFNLIFILSHLLVEFCLFLLFTNFLLLSRFTSMSHFTSSLLMWLILILSYHLVLSCKFYHTCFIFVTLSDLILCCLSHVRFYLNLMLFFSPSVVDDAVYLLSCWSDTEQQSKPNWTWGVASPHCMRGEGGSTFQVLSWRAPPVHRRPPHHRSRGAAACGGRPLSGLCGCYCSWGGPRGRRPSCSGIRPGCPGIRPGCSRCWSCCRHHWTGSYRWPGAAPGSASHCRGCAGRSGGGHLNWFYVTTYHLLNLFSCYFFIFHFTVFILIAPLIFIYFIFVFFLDSEIISHYIKQTVMDVRRILSLLQQGEYSESSTSPEQNPSELHFTCWR